MSFLDSLRTDFSTQAPAYVGIQPTVSFDAAPPERVDTLIIGGGLLGLSTALELAQRGREVALIEALGIGDGPSGRNGGQLWPGFECALSDMIETFGHDLALSAWRLTHEALGQLHARAALRDDHCDFRAGVLLASKTKPQARWIEEEFLAFHAGGLDFCSFVTGSEIRSQFVNTDLYHNGILFRGNDNACQYGHLNPLKYTQHVAQLCVQHGTHLVERCSARAVRALPDGGYVVLTEKGDIQAKELVFATGVDFLRPDGVGFDWIPRIHVPVETIILATEPLPLSLIRDMVPGDACFCDASEAAMNYGCLIAAEDLPSHYRLALGGADALVTLQTAFAVARIEKEMRSMFPPLAHERVRIEAIWGGRCDLSRSGIPVLLQSHDGLYHAGGFSGQGMVNTTLYAKSIAERILKMPSRSFDILQRLNPPAYVNCQLGAWVQAAQVLVPLAIDSYREQWIENQFRSEGR